MKMSEQVLHNTFMVRFQLSGNIKSVNMVFSETFCFLGQFDLQRAPYPVKTSKLSTMSYIVLKMSLSELFRKNSYENLVWFVVKKKFSQDLYSQDI